MADLTPEDFLAWEGRTVRINAIPEPVDVVLAKVQRPERHNNPFREPFSLLFDVPARAYLLDGTYEFDCGRGGPHNIYISQLVPLPDRRRYQAVFN